MTELKKILVANRGEIAIRVLRASQELGLKSVAVYTEEDRDAAHLHEADESVFIGDTTAYLSGEKIIKAAKDSQADAIHPGYGFLSEKASFAKQVEKEGLIFVGPSPQHIEEMGDKVRARQRMEQLGVPIVPGSRGLNSFEEAQAEVAQLMANNPSFQYPLLVKASGGGGGKGMRIVRSDNELATAFERAQSESLQAFGNPELFIERFIERPRHIEVQVFGDEKDAVHLFERECSLQRRHQKVIEEAPSPSISNETRERITQTAQKAAQGMGYRSAGTLEFIVSPEEEFFFLEMNTRIQVEHPVTEWITQRDLIRAQFEVASGKALPWKQNDIQRQGHSIEVRLYAEDADHQFLPQAGQIHFLRFPPWSGIRVDSALLQAGRVSSHYDPMIAKISAWAPDREQARKRLIAYLQQIQLEGLITNRAFLLECLEADFFRAGQYHTALLEQEDWREKKRTPNEVLAALCLKDHLENAPESEPETLSSWQQQGE